MSYSFNHEASQMHNAFCLEEEKANGIISRIIFETIKSNCLEKEFEDAGENVPVDLMKKTATLEKVIKAMPTKQEELFAIFSFMIWHEKTNYIWAKHIETMTKLSSEEVIKKLKDGALEVFSNLSESLLEEKIQQFMKEKMSEFKSFERLKKQVVNSNYDFMLFSAIIDSDHEYVSDIIDKTMHDV